MQCHTLVYKQCSKWTGTAFRFVKWKGITVPFRKDMLERTGTPLRFVICQKFLLFTSCEICYGDYDLTHSDSEKERDRHQPAPKQPVKAHGCRVCLPRAY